MSFEALRRSILRYGLFPVVAIVCTAAAPGADRLIRHKQPDRGSYQPPIIGEENLEAVSLEIVEVSSRADADATDPPVAEATKAVSKTSPGKLRGLPSPITLSEAPEANEGVEQVGFDAATDGAIRSTVAHAAAHRESTDAVQTCSCESCQGGAVSHPILHESWSEGDVVYDAGCDAAPGYGRGFGGGLSRAFCDADSCDGGGCDSISCGRCGWFGLQRDDWFGSLELLLMFRSGDRLPPLATDGPLDPTGANSPQVFAGQETVYKDMTAGGRLTIGAWLDPYKDRHLVARGWFAGEQTFGFSGDQNSHPTLVRPFFNVLTDDQDTLIVASPDEATGRLAIHGDSNVYGADLSIRQLWYKRSGVTVDLLYGYQYMGLDESFTISDVSTSLAEVPPRGSVRSTTDRFDVENDFHGGQFGFATHYREGCWSFSSLVKIGFGSVQRRSVLSGSTLNSIDGNNAIDPNGLLVRSTNAGTRNDNTFGWAPELDFTLGWQQFPSFDVTFGYHIVAMTDALRVSGAIDPALAVNASADPSSNPRPMSIYSDGTFYVQGIHFGLSYIY